MDRTEFIDEVAERTHGTVGDPLTREEVEQVVMATAKVLTENSDVTPAILLTTDD